MEPETWGVIRGFVAGLLVGLVAMSFLAPPISGTSVPSHGLATATGCADADDPSAWVGFVPEGEYHAVYLGNYSFTHEEADIEVRGNLTETATGRWTFALTTSPGDTDKQVPADCQPRTTVDASIALPTSAETLVITIDGEPVGTVHTSDSPEFRLLSE